MTDKKITELTKLTGANLSDTDEFVVVDTSEDETKAITAGQLKNVFLPLSGGTIDGDLIATSFEGDGSALTGLTKTQVGLSGVDNTADTAKPVSTAQQAALDLKANIASPTFTGTVGGITQSMVGLPNTPNLAAADFPVSTAQQTALDLKANTADLGTLAAQNTVGETDIDALSVTQGKLGNNAVSNGKLAQMAALRLKGNSTAGAANAADLTVGAVRTMLAIDQLDNTADAAKPVSTSQQTALDEKANIASPTFTGTVGGITQAMVGLGNLDNTADTAKPVSTAQQTALDLKLNTSEYEGTFSDPIADDDDALSIFDIKTAAGVTILSSDFAGRINIQRDNERILSIAEDDDLLGGYTDIVTDASGVYRLMTYNPDGSIDLSLGDSTVATLRTLLSETGLTASGVPESLLAGNVYSVVTAGVGFIRAWSDVSGISRPYLARSTNAGVYTEEGRTLLDWCIRTGDSTSQGSGQGIAPPIAEAVTLNNGVMFDTGARGVGNDVFVPSTVTDFVAPYEKVSGNLTSTGIASMVRMLDSLQGPLRYVFGARASGQSGERLDEIQTGDRQFENSILELAKAVELAAEYGRGLVCEAVWLSCGTNDRSASRTGAQYLTDLGTLQASYNTRVQAVTSQTETVKVFMDQISAPQGNSSSVLAGEQATAQVEKPLADANFYLACASYFLDKADEVHYHPLSTDIIGEYVAKARTRYRKYGATVFCPMPDLSNITASTGSATIDIDFDLVQVVGSTTVWYELQFTTDLVAQASNEGFRIVDTGGAVISSVVITANGASTGTGTVRVTLDQNPAVGAFIEYAYTGTTPQTHSCAYGNLTDTDTQASLADVGRILINPSPCFRKAIT